MMWVVLVVVVVVLVVVRFAVRGKAESWGRQLREKRQAQRDETDGRG